MTTEQYLIKRWRDLAERYELRILPEVARAYRECADELEQAAKSKEDASA